LDKEIYDTNIKEFPFNFKNNAREVCSNISFLKIEIDKLPSEYNGYLEKYFVDLDIKKNNFFTDISNYISYETGQPTHCYDADKIGDIVRLDFLEQETEIETVVDSKIKLSKSDLVFLNRDNNVINLAGVMGEKNSSCSAKTTSVIIECAFFDPEIIIGKALKYSLNSDAAYKFERHADPSCHDYVLRRFIKVVENHTKITNLQIFSQNYKKYKKNEIYFDYQKLNEIIGINITKEDYVGYLESLNFVIHNDLIIVPHFRSDIKMLNDIAEEMARAVGYDNIKPKTLEIISEITNNIDTSNRHEINIKNLLNDNGFYEVINDPFVPKKDKNSIEIDNPLDSNRKFLRTSLKESLINNLLFNERRQKDSIKLFEISDIYFKDKNSHRKYLGIIASGRVDKNYEDFTKTIDEKYLNGIFQDYINKDIFLKIENIPRTSLESKSKNKIVYCEIELNSLFNISYKSKKQKRNIEEFQYKKISDFPSSSRDLSFSVTNGSELKLLKDYVFNFKNKLLKEAYVFDYFFNEKKEEIKIGFRFVFQSLESTVTDKEVNKVINQIIMHTQSFKNIKIPGLD
jgi:phenylalanyl-tRNA synthetase beta chain